MLHTKIDTFLEDLKLLCSIKEISASNINTVGFKIKEFNLCLGTIAGGGKPEEALSANLFRLFMYDDDYCNLRSETQMRAGDGWVDYLIHGVSGNPIAFELKPLHRLYVTTIEKCSLEDDYKKLLKESEQNIENQIQKYLRDHEYAILTNMEEVYYFDKEARLKFIPFHKEDFIKFADDLRRNGFNIWDMIRKKEDATPKADLDKNFFLDLKKWYEEFREIKFIKGVNVDEKIVQIINKFIFLRTLEDFSLIPWNHIIDSYDNMVTLWKAKGYKKVFKEFFTNLNSWAYLYYDTELFEDNIFDSIEQSDENIKCFQEAVERILGLTSWSMTFGKGLIHYNYRAINEDIFGKTYEIFLSEKREERGIHYTPSIITTAMSKSLVNEIFMQLKNELLDTIKDCQFEKAREIVKKLINIKILDPACGSGSFLVKLLRLLWDLYQEIRNETEWAIKKENLYEPEDITERKQQIITIRQMLGLDSKRKTVALIILRHLYGIDLDEKAIAVAKVNIWKEAIKLSPSDYRHTELSSGIDHILPNLEMNLIHANSLIDFPASVCIKALAGHKDAIKRLHEIRDEYLHNPYNPSVLNECMEIKRKITTKLHKLFEKKYGDISDLPLFAPLNFFFCYFNEDGDPLDMSEQGFPGIIGNPPYDVFVEDKYFKQSIAAGTSNLFSHFIVKGVQFSRSGGAFSFIVPLSFSCGSDCERVRQFVYNNYGYLKTAHYSIRPARLFPEVDQRMTIFLARKKGDSPCIVESSRLYRFTSEERDQIVTNPVTGLAGPIVKGYIPRVADPVGASIYKKFLAIKTTIADYIPDKKDTDRTAYEKWWFHSVGRYWLKAYDFIPYFAREGTLGRSSNIHEMISISKEVAKACVAVVNSNLFYFWWIMQSDEFHLLSSEIVSMPFPDSLQTDNALIVAVNNLMTDYKANAFRKSLDIKGTAVEMDEIHPRKSREFILEIDKILASYYGLDKAALQFLQEYDKRFRCDAEE